MLPGVFKSIKKDGSIYYRASVTFRSKHISLGSFNSENSAHNAYLDALNIINSSTALIPDNYSDGICQSLSFTKWIVLLNFKNNGIYIKTPVYLKKNNMHIFKIMEIINTALALTGISFSLYIETSLPAR